MLYKELLSETFLILLPDVAGAHYSSSNTDNVTVRTAIVEIKLITTTGVPTL